MQAPALRPRLAANWRFGAISKPPVAEREPTLAQSKKAPRRPRVSRFHFHACSPPVLRSTEAPSLPLYSKTVKREFPLRCSSDVDKETITAAARQRFVRGQVWSRP